MEVPRVLGLRVPQEPLPTSVSTKRDLFPAASSGEKLTSVVNLPISSHRTAPSRPAAGCADPASARDARVVTTKKALMLDSLSIRRIRGMRSEENVTEEGERNPLIEEEAGDNKY